MAILSRRGNSNLFAKDKLLPGEQAIVLDKGELWFCHGAGQAKRLLAADDLQTILNASPEAFAALQQLIADLGDDPELSASILNDLAYLKTGMIGTEYPAATYANQIYYKIV